MTSYCLGNKEGNLTQSKSSTPSLGEKGLLLPFPLNEGAQTQQPLHQSQEGNRYSMSEGQSTPPARGRLLPEVPGRSQKATGLRRSGRLRRLGPGVAPRPRSHTGRPVRGSHRTNSPQRLLCTAGARGTPASRPPWSRPRGLWVGWEWELSGPPDPRAASGKGRRAGGPED